MAIKLSNAQVNALANKIKERLTNVLITPIKEINDKVYQSDEYKNFETNDEECLILKRLEKKYDFSTYDTSRQCNLIKQTHFKSKLLKVPSIDYDEIINEIHLATIDAVDLESLINIVSDKFV